MIATPPRNARHPSWGLSIVAAALPIVFAVTASIGIIQANEVAPDSPLAEASTLWMVAVLLASFVVVPALFGVVVGLLVARRSAVAGTVFVLTSLIVMTVAWLLVLVLGLVYGLGDPTPPSEVLTDGDILPRLSAAGVVIFVVPFVVMVAANALAMRAARTGNESGSKCPGALSSVAPTARR